MDVAPGVVTNIRVKRVFYDRYTKPAGNCVEDKSERYYYKTSTMKLMFDKYNVSEYSQDLCKMIAYQEHLLVRCNCTDPALRRADMCAKSSDIKCLEGTLYSFELTPENEYLRSECPIG